MCESETPFGKFLPVEIPTQNGAAGGTYATTTTAGWYYSLLLLSSSSYCLTTFSEYDEGIRFQLHPIRTLLPRCASMQLQCGAIGVQQLAGEWSHHV
jgi:hypothetical protein